jgi:hypothetical protein
MPLSDLFKKSPKQEPPKRPSQEKVFGSPALQKNRVDAATEVMGIFDRHFRTPEGIHAGTVLSAGAWLAGTSLYRSFGYTQNPEPGTVMLSEKANQEFPKLINLFTFYMFQGGTQIKQDQFILQIPDMHKPLKTILQIQEAHQDEYNAIMKKHGLNYADGARAGIIVCSMLFGYLCVRRKDIDPRLGAGIISTEIVTGAKTSPMPLKPESSNATSASTPVNSAENNQFMEVVKGIAKNSTGGSGTRLVLGEGITSMQDAMTKGGKYILVNPGVVDKLKQSNIDPYLIYEAALRIEVESKIPRIDFVGAGVDELLREWSAKPQNQAPFHVRQMLWLNANTTSLGYERRGNSWVLK